MGQRPNIKILVQKKVPRFRLKKQNLFNETVTEKFPNLGKGMDI